MLVLLLYNNSSWCSFIYFYLFTFIYLFFFFWCSFCFFIWYSFVFIYLLETSWYLFLQYSLFLSFSLLKNLYIYFALALAIFLWYFHNIFLLDLIVFLYSFDNKFFFLILKQQKFFCNNPFFSFKSEFFIIFIASPLLMYQNMNSVITFFNRNNSNIIAFCIKSWPSLEIYAWYFFLYGWYIYLKDTNNDKYPILLMHLSYRYQFLLKHLSYHILVFVTILYN